MSTWDNADGLRVKFGTSEADATPKAGFMNTGGNQYNELVIDFLYSDLSTTSVTVIGAGCPIPNGARIISATLYVDTAFDSAAEGASLDLGFIDQDLTTELDYDGLDDGILEADIDAAGDVIECDGVLIDTDLTNAGIVVAKAQGEAFTAGRGILTIQYYNT